MRALRLGILGGLTLSLASCEVIGTIFKIGVWAGILMLLVLLGLIWFLVSLFK